MAVRPLKTSVGADRLARLAARLTDAPIGRVSLLVGGAPTLLGAVGPDVDQDGPDRGPSPADGWCEQVARTGEPLRIDNARDREPAASLPAGGILAFLGVPFPPDIEGAAGSLCVMDTRPRSWTAEDREALLDLAAAAAVGGPGSPGAAVLRGAEEALRESEERFRLMVEGSEEVFFFVHDREGRFTYLSPSVEPVIGYPPHELLGRPYVELLAGDPSDDEVQRRTLKGLETGEAEDTYDTVVRARDGRIVTLEITERPVVRQDRILGTQGFARDVTERRRAATESRRTNEQLRRLSAERERALERAERALAAAERARERLTITLESISDGFFAVDREWRFIYVNRQAQVFFDRPADALIGCSVWEAFPEAADGELARAYRRAMSTQRRVTVETRSSIHPDRWLQATAYPSPEGLSVYYHETTEGKRVQRALEESEARFRQLFEQDLTGNFVSTPDGHLLACNEAFARIFGFDSVEQALTSGVLGISRSPGVRQAFLERIRRDGKVEGLSAEMRRLDGTPVHVVENAYGVFDDDGALIEIRGHVSDESERRRLEDQLRQAQKMEAVGRLAGGVAHDFNNILTAIRGFAALALDELPEREPLREDIQEIVQAADRAHGLTSQLLAFSRRQVSEPRVIDLVATVQRSERMLRRLIGEDVELQVSHPPELERIIADPTQIDQVLVNLVVNARDAMPGGGRLMIETAHVEVPGEPSEPSTGGVPGGSWVRLTVGDTGSGMDRSTRDRMFEPFFTTKEEGRGSGLGLSTVYGIVKQAGGHVTVDTQPGRGTSVHIYLPGTREQADDPAEPQDGVFAGATGSEVVLVVEDQESVRTLVRRLLDRAGYSVLEASGGPQALGVFDREGPVDLLLTDVIMPRMSGRELAERLQRQQPGLPVLYMSGYAEQEITWRGALEPGTRLLSKPFEPAALLAKVREALEAG